MLAARGEPTGIRTVGQEEGSPRSRRGSVSTADRSESLDGLEVRALHRRGLFRPRREHNRRHLQAGGTHGLDRQQRVVDRPEAGRRRDHHRQRQVAGQVPDQIARRERHEEPAHALADQQVGVLGRGQRRAPDPIGIDRLAGELGREVGRDGRAVAIGSHLVVALGRSGGEAEQRVVRQLRCALPDLWPERMVVQSADGGLEDRDPVARRPRRASDRRGHHGLADFGPGPGDEEAAHG